MSELMSTSVSGTSSEVVKDEFSALKLMVGLQITDRLSIELLLNRDRV